jgi:hypothetical protein
MSILINDNGAISHMRPTVEGARILATKGGLHQRWLNRRRLTLTDCQISSFLNYVAPTDSPLN